MLPAAAQRILAELPEDAQVLHVGGGARPFARADWVLDLQPFERRGEPDEAGPSWERFTARTWVQRDACAREPWPFADDRFDLAVVVGTLEALRDPVWVCSELSRVARAGYVEVPTIESELIQGVEGPWLGRATTRWLCELAGGELVFTHKSHAVHADSELRVQPRWVERLDLEDHRQGFFWEGTLPARERFLVGPEHEHALADLRARLLQRFEPTTTELRARQARDVARQGVDFARGPARKVAGRVLGELGKRRPGGGG